MLTLLLSLLVGFVALAVVWRRKTVAPYPPGPPPKPIIGNALDIPSEIQWVKYLEWSKRLKSDIIHMSAMNNHIVVLNKMSDVTELMEKRSGIYSSRPWIPVAEMLGIINLTGVLPYGEQFRRHRVIYHEGLRKEFMPLYRTTHVEKVHCMTDRLLSDPEGFRSHCKWLAVAVTMSTTFGYDIPVQGTDSRYTGLAEQVIAATSTLFQSGGTLVNIFPLLRFIPPWVPGASTQRFAANAKKAWVAYQNEAFEDVKSNFLAGTFKDCLLTRLLSHRLKHDGATFDGEDDLKATMGTIYIETTQVVQIFFFMAMALYPSVQKRIQADIDSVVGKDRLPTYEDRASLPHVEAVLRETLRWQPVLPLPLPHTSVQDDIFKGFYIPKGTIVLPNTWAISQDETIYSNADAFDPERFFNPDGTLNDDTVDYAFGYGRRYCPGKHMARDVLWLMMASVLATFDISKAKDENGAEIEIDPNAFFSGLISAPQEFKCAIVPRSPRAANLIRSAALAVQESMSVGV